MIAGIWSNFQTTNASIHAIYRANFVETTVWFNEYSSLNYKVYFYQVYIYTVSQKTGHQTFVRNFAKYWSIFKILLPADLAWSLH